MKAFLHVLAAAALVSVPDAALAWGAAGHRMAGEIAMTALPREVPAFLRSRTAVQEVGELSREPDRIKGSGRIQDHDRDPAHFLNLDADGKILGGPTLLPLAPTRADYETALRAHGLNSWEVGYLPYAIVASWQRLTSDLAYWRVLTSAEANPAWRANRAWFRADRARREALILKSLGELSHFVTDGSQPLHVTVHYNGWGDYPNPQGYSTARLHAPFEGELVRDRVRPSEVAGLMTPVRLCNCAIEQRVTDYLVATNREVIPFYEMEKAGGMAPGDPRGGAFATRRLAVGASELRDLVVEAWRASEGRSVGWRPIPVADVLSGKTNPYPNLYGID